MLFKIWWKFIGFLKCFINVLLLWFNVVVFFWFLFFVFFSIDLIKDILDFVRWLWLLWFFLEFRWLICLEVIFFELDWWWVCFLLKVFFEWVDKVCEVIWELIFLVCVFCDLVWIWEWVCFEWLFICLDFFWEWICFWGIGGFLEFKWLCIWFDDWLFWVLDLKWGWLGFVCILLRMLIILVIGILGFILCCWWFWRGIFGIGWNGNMNLGCWFKKWLWIEWGIVRFFWFLFRIFLILLKGIFNDNVGVIGIWFMCCSFGGWGLGKLLGLFRLEKRLKKLRKWFIVDIVIEKEG